MKAEVGLEIIDQDNLILNGKKFVSESYAIEMARRKVYIATEQAMKKYSNYHEVEPIKTNRYDK